MLTTLYRAADTDLIYSSCCFARNKADAKEYTHNSGFGGSNLYKTKVNINPKEVLDLTDLNKDKALQKLADITGHHPGACTPDYYVMQGETVDALIRAGYSWVKLIDTFPEDCETWVYLYGSKADEPELEEIE